MAGSLRILRGKAGEEWVKGFYKLYVESKECEVKGKVSV